MVQLQQIHKKHMEHQQRQNQQQQQQHLHSINNLHNNNNNNNGGMNNGGHKERSNTLSQLLEKNRGDRPQPTKAALTMPPSFQRGGDRSLNIGASAGHSQSPFASLPSHMPHLPVRFYLQFFMNMGLKLRHWVEFSLILLKLYYILWNKVLLYNVCQRIG